MDKKHLTEQEIRTRYITPAIRDAAGWMHNQLSVAPQFEHWSEA